MLKEIIISGPVGWSGDLVEKALRDEFPGLPLLVQNRNSSPIPALGPRGEEVVVSAAVWEARSFDPVQLDEWTWESQRAHGDYALRIEGLAAVADGPRVALQIVTRCQRHLRTRNGASRTPTFDRVLALHRGMHDVRKPLVAADYEHALDTWRWVLRLAPGASLPVQVAALFHDVERLLSEAEVRVEQHARDYVRFKTAHARAGSTLAARALQAIGAEAAVARRVQELVATHEQADGDPERMLLNEADALSFFSLNSCGFIAYYGRAHTEKKIAYTLARLGPRGRRYLDLIRHRADIAGIVRDAIEEERQRGLPLPPVVATEVRP